MSCCGLTPPKRLPCRLFGGRVSPARFIVTSVASTLPMAVTTQVPPFAVKPIHPSTSLPSQWPTVTIALRHIAPEVASAIPAVARATSGNASVAPNFRACSRFHSNGSTAKTLLAPAIRRALQRGDAGAADPDDRDVVTGRDGRASHRRAVAGGHPAAHQAYDVEGDRGVDFDDRVWSSTGGLRPCAQSVTQPRGLT